MPDPKPTPECEDLLKRIRAEEKTVNQLPARLLAGPSSCRILSARRRVVGARMLKWVAPRTARKCAFGLCDDRASIWSATQFPWTPSNTNVGDRIDASHR
jgi:hypothetical protein